MDYVLGSVAALISGNVTPNRPKLNRRALTPTKHQSSPNVTPKSEFVEDRSIFLSPTQQKKKAIIKKSPKRIFQNPDLDTTQDIEGNSTLSSPKAEKVKKHLKEELDAANMGKKISTSQESSFVKEENLSDDVTPNKKSKIIDNNDYPLTKEITPKKKKQKRNSESNVSKTDDMDTKTEQENILKVTESNVKSPKKKMSRRISTADISNIQVEESVLSKTCESHNKQQNLKSTQDDIKQELITEEMEIKQNIKKKKHNKKNKKPVQSEEETVNTKHEENKIDESATQASIQKSGKKKKNRKKLDQNFFFNETLKEETIKGTEKTEVEEGESESDEVKAKNIPNPNAITEKDSDSEHDSDDEIESENEEANKKLLKNENEEQDHSTDDEENDQNTKKKVEMKKEERGAEIIGEEEIKRTLFVGNVPYNKRCKKEIKKIFNVYGRIETIRIRTIPVKDARVTPKLAIIKNELHPERTTVNVYVKYADPASVGKAIAANNTIHNGNHLRVSRSDVTGSEHDPRCAVFVGNMPFAIEDETLRSKFEKCGEIDSVRIIRDKKTNAGKGFGYVNFTSKDGVELALSMSEEDLTIKNRIMRVKRCTQGPTQGRGQGQRQRQREGAPRHVSKWSQGQQQQVVDNGAARRLMHKRKQQEGGNEGPSNKRPKNINQPNKEKKQRKEFVGMTAEKKKKHKFNKDHKKKKALSEILTKY